MSSRDRAEGWKHAKVSGHENEELIKHELNTNASLGEEIKKRLKKTSSIRKADVGGLCEESVNSLLGGVTKSKTDLIIEWDNNTSSNISIKKSRGGQVYLIGTTSFMQGYQLQFEEEIPEDVKEALCLFFGEGKDIPSILDEEKFNVHVNEKIRNYELRKKRLVWDSLLIYNENYASSLLQWFNENIDKITTFCFSRGLAKDESDWAEYIWYKNLLGEDSMDLLYSIDELSSLVKAGSEAIIKPGTRGGGTTIQLPFGFVQWHQGKMQFHHSYESIKKYQNI